MIAKPNIGRANVKLKEFVKKGLFLLDKVRIQPYLVEALPNPSGTTSVVLPIE